MSAPNPAEQKDARAAGQPATRKPTGVAFAPSTKPARGAASSDKSSGSHKEAKSQERSPDGKWVRTAKKLGSGSFKKVYVAVGISGEEAAWNVIKLRSMNPSQKKKVRKEVEILKECEHKHIMEFLGTWETPTSLNFVTEKASATIGDRIKALHPVAISTIRVWCVQILDALIYLHGRKPMPIIHRDIKAENVFVASDGTIRLGDFGLAIECQTSNSIKGSPAFMAPEVFQKGEYGSKVDLYAFGMLVLEMRSNRTPYEERKMLLTERIQEVIVPPPQALDAKLFDVPPKRMNALLRELIVACIENNPENRPTASEAKEMAFFKPELFRIKECKVEFRDEKRNLVTVTMVTNVPSRETASFQVDLKKETLLDIAKEFESSFGGEIRKVYPDSAEQDIADTIHRLLKEKVKSMKESGLGFDPRSPSTVGVDVPPPDGKATKKAPSTLSVTTGGSGDSGESQQVVPVAVHPHKKSIGDLGDFKVADIKVEATVGESGENKLRVVNVCFVITEGLKENEVKTKYTFGVDGPTSVAKEMIKAVEKDPEKFPQHVEYIAHKLKEAIKEHKQLWKKRILVDFKVGLEDILAKAGITDEGVMKRFMDEEVTAEDLMNPNTIESEEDLKGIVTKLGPRRRLWNVVKELREERGAAEAKKGSPRERQVGTGQPKLSGPEAGQTAGNPVTEEPSEPDRKVQMSLERSSSVP